MQGPLPPTPGTKEKKNKERKTATILQDLVKSGVGTLLRLSQGQRLSQGRRGGVPTAAGPRPRSTAAAPTAGGGRRRRNPHPAAPQPHIPTSRHRDIPASCIPTSRHRDIPASCTLQPPSPAAAWKNCVHPYGSASLRPSIPAACSPNLSTSQPRAWGRRCWHSAAAAQGSGFYCGVCPDRQGQLCDHRGGWSYTGASFLRPCYKPYRQRCYFLTGSWKNLSSVGLVQSEETALQMCMMQQELLVCSRSHRCTGLRLWVKATAAASAPFWCCNLVLYCELCPCQELSLPSHGNRFFCRILSLEMTTGKLVLLLQRDILLADCELT